MINPVVMFQDGGPFMYLLLLGFPAALAVALMLMAVSLFRIRMPLPVWVLPPVLLIGVGLLGTAQGMGLALEAIAYASAEMKSTLAAAGYSVALYTTAGGWMLASFVFVALTWAVGIGHLRADPDDEWDVATTIGVGLGALVLGAIVGALGFSQGTGPLPIFVGVVTAFAGLGLSLVALRASEEPESRARLAEGRFVAAALAMGAPLSAGALASVSGWIQAMEARAHASAEMKDTLMAYGLQAQSAGYTVGTAGVLVAGLLGLVIALPRARYIPGLRLAMNLIGTALVLLPLLAMAGWTASRGAALQTVVDASFAHRGSYDLQAPTVAGGRPPTRRGVDVVLSKRELLVDGRFICRLETTVELETGVERVVLPPEFATEGAGQVREALAGLSLDGTAILQADRRLPVSVLRPVVAAVKAGGGGAIELVVYGDVGEAVIDLPGLPEDRPHATLEELLR